MAYCSKCGTELRRGVKFCTKCGARSTYTDDIDDDQPIPQGDGSENFTGAPEEPASEGPAYTEPPKSDAGAQANDVPPHDVPPQSEPKPENDTRPTGPTIVLAPPKVRSKQSMAKGVIKTLIGCILVIAIIIGGVWATAWVMSNPFRTSNIEQVDNEKYTRMLALVEDVRNPNFDEVIDDLLTKKGKAEDYSFLQEYTDKFNEILGTDYTEEEKLFCDCCYFVWYTEYQAKRYEWLSENSGLLNGIYVKKATTYRSYADTLYEMLCNADSVTDMNNIKQYCADHEIISDNTESK